MHVGKFKKAKSQFGDEFGVNGKLLAKKIRVVVRERLEFDIVRAVLIEKNTSGSESTPKKVWTLKTSIPSFFDPS